MSGKTAPQLHGNPASLRARLDGGGLLIGLMVEQFARPALVKVLAHAGFDFVFLEYEHTFFSQTEMADTILAARDNGLPVIVKTPQLERQEVSKLLEAGVHGIQLPRTETREQVEELLGYMRYPPKGTRAVAPGWGSSDHGPVPDWRAWMDAQDRETVLVAHIETALGIQNAPEIVSATGVGMVYVGMADLSAELGHPGEYDNPVVKGAAEKVLALCKKHKVPFGTTPTGPEAARRWVAGGARFFLADSEIGLLRRAAGELLSSYRPR
ncbi:MAG: hypothetical protein FJ317_02245 [SAR202 cluster bacterium]|nr:hypothetical protein [SAR202 cluster bacterium]